MWLILAALGVATMLVACGNNGSSNPSANPTITGLAAGGGALGSATMTAKCASGAPVTGTTSADGTFTLELGGGQTFPCIVRVNAAVPLHGFAAEAGHINVTPLTDLVISRALGLDATSAFDNFDAAKGAAIAAGLVAAKAYVIVEVTPLAGRAPSVDPLTGVFTIGDADDKVLDNLTAALAATPPPSKTLDDLRLAAVSAGSLAAALGPEETRPQDSLTFTPTVTPLAAMAAAPGDVVDMSTTSRWTGVLNGAAAYHVEVPATWNGKLVMYAHGFAGGGAALFVQDPSIRRFLIQNGYAWAASSYSKNNYDVRAGVEDTNALALAFTSIAALNSRTLAAPSRIYITGHSMGGHITAAAIEDEAFATASNKVKYAGAVPMCGVVGDTELFNEFGAMQVTAQAEAGVPDSPVTSWNTVAAQVLGTLFSSFPSAAAPTAQIATTAAGANWASAVENFTGGTRPLFAQGLAFGGSFPGGSLTTFGGDGTVTGILTKNVVDTNAFTYTIDGDAAASAALNASAQDLTAVAGANRLRHDGLRWIPVVNGEFRIPVVTIHTLGDLFVPFSMEQVYQKRVAAKGNGVWLVQRAIRGASHCDFTVAEQASAFDDMIKWERDGIKPSGDDVVTAATVAAPTFGCTFTNNTLGPDDGATVTALRAGIAATTAPCP